MAPEKFSALGRPMDYSDHTNVAIVVITFLTLISSYLYLVILGGFVWNEAIWPTIGITFSVFFAWAISREINPDYSYSAFFGVAIIIIMIIYNEYILQPHYLTLLWVLLFERMLNRTVGYKAKLFDSALMVGITIWLSFTYSWIAGIIAAFVFWLDATLQIPQPRHRILTLLVLLIAIVAFIINPVFLPNIFTGLELLVLITISVLFLAFIFMTKEVKSKADLTPLILNKQRLRFTQAFTLISLLLFSIVNGVETFYGLAALWSAMAGVFIHSLFIKSGKKTKYVDGGHETIVK
jgi:hypothetical protein